MVVRNSSSFKTFCQGQVSWIIFFLKVSLKYTSIYFSQVMVVMYGLECKLRQFALKRSVSQPGVVTTQVLILGVFVCFCCCCFIVLIVILEEKPKHLLYTLEYLIFFFLHQETVYKSQPCVVALKCLCDLFTCQFFGLLHKMAKINQQHKSCSLSDFASNLQEGLA